MRGGGKTEKTDSWQFRICCRTDYPNAYLILRLLALYRFAPLFVILTRLGMITILATLELDRYNEKAVGSGGMFSVFLTGACEQSVHEQRKWRPRGTNPFSATGASS